MTPEPNATYPSKERLASLYQEYSAMVYRTAYWILGTREEAEDALNDVFLALYRTLPLYDPNKGKISTWIYRITVNHCLKRKTRVLWRFLPLDARSSSFESQENRPLEEDSELMESLRRLPAQLKALVVLRYGWQLPYAEIGQILDLPLGTVKSRHSLALEKLRKYFGLDRMPYGLQDDSE